MENPTIHDVAHLAGVSSATADRVLNRRGNVASKSIRKVEDAVQKLGYVRNSAAARLSKNKAFRIAFVLPRKDHGFFGRMHLHLVENLSHFRNAGLSIKVFEFAAFDGEALNLTLKNIRSEEFDGVAFVGQQTQEITKTLDALRKHGLTIVSLVSDVPENYRDYYIGIDNRKAGRTAARLIGRFHRGDKGKIILIAGSMDVGDHFERISGFKEVIDNDFPNIELTSTIETFDQPNIMRRELRSRLEGEHSFTAIYNAGAGNEGLVDVLRFLDPQHFVFSITHEISPIIREGLLEGIIDVALDQRPEIEISRALMVFQATNDKVEQPVLPELIPAIYVRDNLPQIQT